jgi:hypothetical protein
MKHQLDVTGCQFPATEGYCDVHRPKSEMYQDACGYYWCNEHKHRGALLTWAQQHGYPAIEFTGPEHYAIGDPDYPHENEKLWKAAILMGKEDAIWAAIGTAMSDDEFMELLVA